MSVGNMTDGEANEPVFPIPNLNGFRWESVLSTGGGSIPGLGEWHQWTPDRYSHLELCPETHGLLDMTQYSLCKASSITSCIPQYLENKHQVRSQRLQHMEHSDCSGKSHF